MPTEQPYKRELTEAEYQIILKKSDAACNDPEKIAIRDNYSYYAGFCDALSSLPSPEEIEAMKADIKLLRDTIRKVRENLFGHGWSKTDEIIDTALAATNHYIK